jgi:hypothetical protein
VANSLLSKGRRSVRCASERSKSEIPVQAHITAGIRRIRPFDPFAMISIEPLPFDLDKYFNRPPGATEIDLALLVPNPKRMGKIQKARELMCLAGEGKHPKRDPISILRIDKDSFEILDGNSTYAVAESSNWPRILAIEFNSEVDSNRKPINSLQYMGAKRSHGTNDGRLPQTWRQC